MAKGYWIGHVDVHDAEAYKAYIAAATPAYEEFGANFLVRGGPFEPVEGTASACRFVMNSLCKRTRYALQMLPRFQSECTTL